jgi:hypothetical protein
MNGTPARASRSPATDTSAKRNAIGLRVEFCRWIGDSACAGELV